MFFVGVVEDNSSDELEMGRVKTRIFSVHTNDRIELPTADLPWCLPIGGGISEVGSFNVPEQGSWVVCGFLDPLKQQPFYMGTINRFETAVPDFTDGFSDPDGVYPTAANIGRSSIPLEAIGSTLSSSHVEKVASKGTYEPIPPGAAVYPNNKVMKTAAGHVVEFDDTPGAERINIQHASGSFVELHPNGDGVIKIKKDRYDITLGNNTIEVDGNNTSHVAGSQTENIGGVLDITVTGKCTLIADTVDIDGGGVLSGVVNRNCMCAFTGQDHPDYSVTTEVSK
jgi:hypothetical protein